MDPRHHLFVDERLTGMCVYCGAEPDTRDHVPSKVLLDKPYPPQLPVVGACNSCNASFSLDEQYLACFIECVVCGTVDDADLQRPNVKRILAENPRLRDRIDSSRKKDGGGNPTWQPEIDRVRKIVLKLAQGHAAYELYPVLEEPLEVSFVPLPTLGKGERTAFEDVSYDGIGSWPEIGSRSFLRAAGKNPDQFVQSGDWIIVQPNLYRYAVIETGGMHVRIVLSEYLACEVIWE